MMKFANWLAEKMQKLSQRWRARKAVYQRVFFHSCVIAPQLFVVATDRFSETKRLRNPTTTAREFASLGTGSVRKLNFSTSRAYRSHPLKPARLTKPSSIQSLKASVPLARSVALIVAQAGHGNGRSRSRE
ncbi:MAG: hypothetical protein JOZ14_12360 [Acidobacteria bacterium]|nr:hypothetical protein [Acidobacteriota bacterium]